MRREINISATLSPNNFLIGKYPSKNVANMPNAEKSLNEKIVSPKIELNALSPQ